MLEDRRSWRKRYPTSQAAVPTSFFRYPDRWMLSEQQDQCAYSGIHLTLIIQSTVALRGQVCHRNAQAHSAAKQSLRVLVCKTQHYLDNQTDVPPLLPILCPVYAYRRRGIPES